MDAVTIFLVVAALAAAVLFSVAISAAVSAYLYKRATEKAANLPVAEKELSELLTRLVNQRSDDKKEFDTRLLAIEHKIDVLMMPEGVLKETELERIKVAPKA